MQMRPRLAGIATSLLIQFQLTEIPNGEFIVQKTIFSSRQRFPKPLWVYEMLGFFGGNIVTTEFDEWKRHRKIAAPAFSEVMNRVLSCVLA